MRTIRKLSNRKLDELQARMERRKRFGVKISVKLLGKIIQERLRRLGL